MYWRRKQDNVLKEKTGLCIEGESSLILFNQDSWRRKLLYAMCVEGERNGDEKNERESSNRNVENEENYHDPPKQ